mmetsp:Transcript_12726/g.27220  ORF Transcript_12726/g.27220 Transcript_12726/m.27220 type:complete len:102 (-) Transcript_12726:12-317(-)
MDQAFFVQTARINLSPVAVAIRLDQPACLFLRLQNALPQMFLILINAIKNVGFTQAPLRMKLDAPFKSIILTEMAVLVITILCVSTIGYCVPSTIFAILKT